MNSSSPAAPIKGHCPECGPNRISNVVGFHERHEEDADGLVWANTEYRILQCCGCEAVYFQTNMTFSEDWDHETNPVTGDDQMVMLHTIKHWPAASTRKKPEWSLKLIAIDTDLNSLFDDIYSALNSDLRVLSAIGIRTVFDRASELLGVDPAKGFADKLAELVQLGKVGVSEKLTLDALTDAGSAAAHRGWKPTPEQLDTMMGIIEAFLYRVFILDAAAKTLKLAVPTKPKRKKP